MGVRDVPAVLLRKGDANHWADEGGKEEVGQEFGVRVPVITECKEEEDQNHFFDCPANAVWHLSFFSASATDVKF